MSKNPLQRLVELGQSPWYDYITRDLLRSGELRRPGPPAHGSVEARL